jgi:DNA-binding SARP family transcriptional activator
VSEPWNEWLDLERERVKAMVIRTLLSYGEEALSFGNADAATDAAERVLSIDCASEPSYQLLIRAHKSIGRDSAAAIAYRRCCEVMRRDIGVAPDAETTRLIGGEVAAAAEWDLALAKSFPGEASRTYRDGFKLGYGRGMLRGYEKAIEALSLQGRWMLRGHEKAIEALSLNLARAKERLDIHH